MKNYNTISGKGYSYINQIPEIQENGIPRGFLNKKKSDVGVTYSVLSSKLDFVMCSKSIVNIFLKV